MKPPSRNLLAREAHSLQHTAHSMVIVLSAVCCLLSASGCESFQRKFQRKSKSERPPTPIISFHDYSGTMTPLERYRKHYLMFEYWNQDVIDALQVGSPNPKRYRQSSEEALNELHTLQSLLNDDLAARLTPLIEERTKIHRQIQSPVFNASQAAGVAQSFDRQTRQIHREFFWRDVQEHLKPAPAPPALAQQEGNAASH